MASSNNNNSPTSHAPDDPLVHEDWLEILSLLEGDAPDAIGIDHAVDNDSPSLASVVPGDDNEVAGMEGEVFFQEITIGPWVQWLIRHIRHVNPGHPLVELSDQPLARLIHRRIVPDLRRALNMHTASVEELFAFVTYPRPTSNYTKATEGHKMKRRPSGMKYKKNSGDKKGNKRQKKGRTVTASKTEDVSIVQRFIALTMLHRHSLLISVSFSVAGLYFKGSQAQEG